VLDVKLPLVLALVALEAALALLEVRLEVYLEAQVQLAQTAHAVVLMDIVVELAIAAVNTDSAELATTFVGLDAKVVLVNVVKLTSWRGLKCNTNVYMFGEAHGKSNII
jgi:hypothetical protein